MGQFGILAASVAASTVILSFATPVTAASSQSGTSSELLLSPRLRVGQSVKWNVELGLWYYKNSSHAKVRGDMHSMAITCAVENKTEKSFTVSRTVSGFVNDQGIPTEASTDHGHWNTFPLSPMVIRAGQDFKVDSKPLHDEPDCMFYSTAWFGVPPAILTRGTTWKFIRPAWILSFRQSEHGVVTVKSVDSTTGVTVLTISATPPNVRTVVERYDVTIADGGLITTESRRSEGPTRPGNVTLHYVTVWTLAH